MFTSVHICILTSKREYQLAPLHKQFYPSRGSQPSTSPPAQTAVTQLQPFVPEPAGNNPHSRTTGTSVRQHCQRASGRSGKQLNTEYSETSPNYIQLFATDRLAKGVPCLSLILLPKPGVSYSGRRMHYVPKIRPTPFVSANAKLSRTYSEPLVFLPFLDLVHTARRSAAYTFHVRIVRVAFFRRCGAGNFRKLDHRGDAGGGATAYGCHVGRVRAALCRRGGAGNFRKLNHPVGGAPADAHLRVTLLPRLSQFIEYRASVVGLKGITILVQEQRWALLMESKVEGACPCVS